MRYSEMIAREKLREWRHFDHADLHRMGTPGRSPRRWVFGVAALGLALGMVLF